MAEQRDPYSDPSLLGPVGVVPPQVRVEGLAEPAEQSRLTNEDVARLLQLRKFDEGPAIARRAPGFVRRM